MIDEDRFGARLRYERERRDWTQAYVADRLAEEGVKLHASAIAKMEYRDIDRPRTIRLDEAAALARVFGLPLQEMISSPEDRFYEIELAARKLSMLSEQAKDAAVQFMDEIYKFGDFRKLHTSDAKYVREALMNLERAAQSARERYVHSLSLLEEALRNVEWSRTEVEMESVEDTGSDDDNARHRHALRRMDAYFLNLMEADPDKKLDNDEFATIGQHVNGCSSCMGELLDRAHNQGYDFKEVVQRHLDYGPGIGLEGGQ